MAVNSAQVEGCAKTAASTVHFKKVLGRLEKTQPCSNISALIDGVSMAPERSSGKGLLPGNKVTCGGIGTRRRHNPWGLASSAE